MIRRRVAAEIVTVDGIGDDEAIKFPQIEQLPGLPKMIGHADSSVAADKRARK
ncbi:MAG: hypothetical protein KatS3mg059_0259 [Thermomicrobiales bacterium]|nr:MAG: hypothetical protein KatS3mg059_0259 [Thermomicrobiales bacterium]